MDRVLTRERIVRRADLKKLHERLLSVAGKDVLNRIRCIIRDIITIPLVSVTSNTRLKEAIQKMNIESVPFLLVQDSQATIAGILRHEVAESLEFKDRTEQIPVSAIMDRNICIESDQATVIEVMSRIVFSGVASAVIVDEQGEPSFIVTPQSIIDSLEDLVPAIEQALPIAEPLSETGLGSRVPLY